MTNGIILLHGAGLGSWIWDSVIPSLKVKPYAIDLPGRSTKGNPRDVGLITCVDAICRAMDQHGLTSAILVAHSISAEAVLAIAATYPNKVAGIIFVSGIISESGKSYLSVLPLLQQLFLRLILSRAAEGISLPRNLVKNSYCNDLDDQTTNGILEKLVPEAPRLYTDTVEWSNISDSLPRLYVRLLKDRSVPIKLQNTFIKRVHAKSVDMNTGHLPMIAQPKEMADIINGFAVPIQS